ncbi:hypothetical protein H0W26_03520, partial [Candidatus Dependentiae bacterium]|nr:hypothetical protein [Candidatus Dependentiae bacterium]
MNYCRTTFALLLLMGLTTSYTHAMEHDTNLQENNSLFKSSVDYALLYSKPLDRSIRCDWSPDGSILLYQGTC